MIDDIFFGAQLMKIDLLSFWFFGSNAFYHCADNRSLTRSGFLGTHEDSVQDVTV